MEIIKHEYTEDALLSLIQKKKNKVEEYELMGLDTKGAKLELKLVRDKLKGKLNA